MKETLLKTYSLSEDQRASKLINSPELGDTSASEFMDKMLGLLRDHPPCFLFRHLFLSRLPEQIRAILVHSKIADMRELAAAADELINSFHLSCSTIQRPASTKQKTAATRQKKDSTTEKANTCFFHRRFGNSARKCVPPCAFANRTQILEITEKSDMSTENYDASCW